MQKRWVYGLLAILGGLIVLFYYNKYRVVPSIDIKKLEILNENGEAFDINSLKGKKLIVSFYASWCGNCIQEMREINKIKNTELNGVDVICITDESLEKLIHFKEASGYPYMFLKLNKQFPEIGINSIPVTYIVNEKLEVVEEYLGYIDWKDPSTLNYIKSLY